MPYWDEFLQSFADACASSQIEIISFTAGDLSISANQQILNKSILQNLLEVECLLIRSTTKVNQYLLNLMPNLRFVGTATAGYDHLDIKAIESRNIRWYAAGGCNAQAVAQYVVCACLHLACTDEFVLQDKTIAVIGHGNVGGKVANSMRALGARVIIFDPPQQHSINEGSQHNYALFEEVLSADIICLHAPLNSHPDYPSLHMFNHKVLAQLTAHQYVINAGRGELIDNAALLDIFTQDQSINRPSVNIVLDVWEHEPTILTALIPYTRLATAHIAGHTLEGRANGTYMLYHQLCALYNVPESLSLDNLLPLYQQQIPVDSIACSEIITRLDQRERQNLVKNLCEMTYEIQNDDRVFRRHMAQSPSFAKIRQQYPIRREFSALPVNVNNNSINELLRGLGFIISNDSNTPLLNK